MQISLISDSQSQRLFSSAVWSRVLCLAHNLQWFHHPINIQFPEYHSEYAALYSEWPPLHVWLLAGVGLLPITKIYWLLVLDRSVQLAQSSRLLLEWSDPPPCQQQAAASCIRANIRVIIRVMLLTSCHICIIWVSWTLGTHMTLATSLLSTSQQIGEYGERGNRDRGIRVVCTATDPGSTQSKLLPEFNMIYL